MNSPVNRRPPLLARAIAKHLLALPARWKWGFEVVHAERLPRRRRPLVVTANHAARIDTFFLIQAIGPRFTVCGAQPPYFRTPLRRLLMAVANILRVEDRETFLADCRELLRSDEIVLIYPEMGRNPEGTGEFSTWAAEVALEADVPLLPCYLYGTTRGHTGRVRLIVGREIEPHGDAATLTERLRRAIVALEPGVQGKPQAAEGGAA